MNEQEIKTIIADRLHCGAEEIGVLTPMKKGFTNESYSFECRGSSYVFRCPGASSEMFIDRKRETAINLAAAAAGLDPSLIAIDAEGGWKLSRLVDFIPFDTDNKNHVKLAFESLHRVHELPTEGIPPFDLWKDIELYAAACDIRRWVDNYEELFEQYRRLNLLLEGDAVGKCCIHGDAKPDNILISPDEKDVCLIDWELGAFGDPNLDIASYAIGFTKPLVLEAVPEPSAERTEEILELWYGRTPTRKEKRCLFAVMALLTWYMLHGLRLREQVGICSNIDSLFDAIRIISDRYRELAFALYEEKE